MMKKILFALLMLTGIYCGSAWAAAPDGQEDICSQPWVIWCDNFEDRTVATTNPGIQDLTRAKYKNSGWALSTTSGMGVTTEKAFDGTKSFVFNYPAVSNPWPNLDAGGVGFLDSSFPPTRDLYYRWYTTYSPSWKQSPISEKHMEIDGGWIGHFFLGLFGSPKPIIVTQYSNTNVNDNQNLTSITTIGDTAWHCLETHVRVNSTLTGTDGLLEAWIDGTQSILYSNFNVSNQQTTQTYLRYSGYWNCDGDGTTYSNNPANNRTAQSRYHDNIVVGTQRIGCLASDRAKDLTPPSPPINLQVF